MTVDFTKHLPTRFKLITSINYHNQTKGGDTRSAKLPLTFLEQTQNSLPSLMLSQTVNVSNLKT